MDVFNSVGRLARQPRRIEASNIVVLSVQPMHNLESEIKGITAIASEHGALIDLLALVSIYKIVKEIREVGKEIEAVVNVYG